MLTYFSVYDIIMPKCIYAHDLLKFFLIYFAVPGLARLLFFVQEKMGEKKIKTFHFFEKKIINFKKE